MKLLKLGKRRPSYYRKIKKENERKRNSFYNQFFTYFKSEENRKNQELKKFIRRLEKKRAPKLETNVNRNNRIKRELETSKEQISKKEENKIYFL